MKIKLDESADKYLIVDIENYRYVLKGGWVTNKVYAEQFTRVQMHKELADLRKRKHFKVTFEKVEIEKIDKDKLRVKERVKTAVKQVIKQSYGIVELVEKATSRAQETKA